MKSIKPSESSAVIASWDVGVRESVALARGTLLTLRGRKVIPELVICPPFVALSEVRKVIARSHAALGAQNMAWEAQGAFTGEISPRMLEELGVTHVILGHSERRQLLGETDEMINKKVQKALDHDLIVVLCVGETSDERNSGTYRDAIKDQLLKALNGIRLKSSDRLLIAYEPVWAIGTGHSAELEQVLEMHEWIKAILTERFSEIRTNVRVLYGGSVDTENAYRFLREPLVDGVLVGSASVKINQFNDIVHAASEVLDKRHRGFDDLRVHFQTDAGHAHWILDAFLPVQNEFFRNHVENLPISRNLDGLGSVNDPDHITLSDFPIGPSHRDHAMTFQTHHMSAIHRDHGMLYGNTGHALSFFQSLGNRRHGFFNIGNHPAANPGRHCFADTNDGRSGSLGFLFTHHHPDGGGADIQAN